MQQPTRLYYGDERRTWHGVPRIDIEDRERPMPAPWQPFIGRVLIALPGFDLDWTLRQDRRDLRRFHALDLDGAEHALMAPRELMRHLSTVVPRYHGQR